ncbi:MULTISPECIES: sigma-54 interaction domain-containing protein [Pseudescherichia]|uniref:sigma-54 interaction domain-containing protein n=1 Tax=Pseudescherichia TaxID=2055880 RepID=UPI001EDCFB72|nr:MULTISPECIES: sigma-54 dependent transcriptional regulator [Pseudescherichia]
MLNFIAQAPASIKIFTLGRRVARFNIPVLLLGETGAGKECVAKYIHAMAFNGDRTAPFIGINCAAIPESMLESTLFGYEKGAFTGAVNAVAGKFEMANNGTLLLDEIGDMTLALQAKLLRVLQERQVERLGSHRTIKLNFRLIASTNKNLESEVAAGRFREDLFYRLSVMPITVPPLRERPEDILPLAEAFLKKYAHSLGKNIRLSETAEAALVNYRWPGNVRQLENAVQRGMILNQDGVIPASALGIPFAQGAEAANGPAATRLAPASKGSREDLQRHGRVAQYHYIADLMRQYQGNRSQIADCLGITPRALRYRLASMRKHGMDITI